MKLSEDLNQEVSKPISVEIGKRVSKKLTSMDEVIQEVNNCRPDMTSKSFAPLNPAPVLQFNQNFNKNNMRQTSQQGADEGESVMLVQNQSSMTPQLAKVVQYPLNGNSSIHYRCSMFIDFVIKERYYRLQQQMIAQRIAAMSQLNQSFEPNKGTATNVKDTLPKTKN